MFKDSKNINFNQINSDPLKKDLLKTLEQKKLDSQRFASRLAPKKIESSKLNFKRRVSIYLAKLWFWVKCVCAISIMLIIILYHSSIQTFCTQKFYDITSYVGFNVENIVIQDRKNASLDEILSIIGVIKHNPIFSVKINEIKAQLENYSWIKEALVIRQLPCTIHIKLIEKEPIAIWQKNQKLSLIDLDGVVIINANIEKFNYLIHVVGDDANIYAYSLIKLIPQDFMTNIISAVRFGNRRWNLVLKNGIAVKMPEENFESAVKYLLKLNNDGKLFNSEIKSLDLRNHQKYYIEYKK